jgi:hypothetical protein
MANTDNTIAIVVESTYNSGKGRVRVFEWINNTWLQRGYDIPDSSDIPTSLYNDFGKSITLDNQSLDIYDYQEIKLEVTYTRIDNGLDETGYFQWDVDTWMNLEV